VKEENNLLRAENDNLQKKLDGYEESYIYAETEESWEYERPLI